MKALLLIILIHFSGQLSASQLVELGDAEAAAPLLLWQSLSVLEDPKGLYQVEDFFQSGADYDWQAKDWQRPPYFGFTDSVYWGRVRLDNQSKNSEFYVEYTWPQVDDV